MRLVLPTCAGTVLEQQVCIAMRTGAYCTNLACLPVPALGQLLDLQFLRTNPVTSHGRSDPTDVPVARLR